MFYAVKCQDLFGRDGSSTGPWGKYQNIDESSALKNMDTLASRVENVTLAVQLLSADGKPVEPKQKHQAFSSLFFVLLMSFIIKQDEKRKEACRSTRFPSALIKNT